METELDFLLLVGVGDNQDLRNLCALIVRSDMMGNAGISLFYHRNLCVHVVRRNMMESVGTS